MGQEVTQKGLLYNPWVIAVGAGLILMALNKFGPGAGSPAAAQTNQQLGGTTGDELDVTGTARHKSKSVIEDMPAAEKQHQARTSEKAMEESVLATVRGIGVVAVNQKEYLDMTLIGEVLHFLRARGYTCYGPSGPCRINQSWRLGQSYWSAVRELDMPRTEKLLWINVSKTINKNPEYGDTISTELVLSCTLTGEEGRSDDAFRLLATGIGFSEKTSLDQAYSRVVEQFKSRISLGENK